MSDEITVSPATFDALLCITEERVRQLTQKGYSTAHDDEHVCEELASMATYYAMPAGVRDWPVYMGYGDTLGEAVKPDGWVGKVGDRRRELIKAAALIVAEIERLDRTFDR